MTLTQHAPIYRFPTSNFNFGHFLFFLINAAPTFASAKHFHAKNADGEASNKYANLQSKYAGNLAKIKTLKRRMDAWDMISPFVIPDFIDP